jgi:hypothetical protein
MHEGVGKKGRKVRRNGRDGRGIGDHRGKRGKRGMRAKRGNTPTRNNAKRCALLSPVPHLTLSKFPVE